MVRQYTAFLLTCSAIFSIFVVSCTQGDKATHHVWEKVEIVLEAQKSYKNPYMEVEVWVDLKGPEFDKRCFGFWDGNNIFRIRVLAITPGNWTWRSGSNQSDSGLSGKKGSFIAVEWSEVEKEENPNRRGMVKPSANGHAFEYNDGSIYFLLGDTWWPTGTFRYPWFEEEEERPIGPAAGFKDYVKYRRKQGYNCIAMVAAFPNWVNDDKPANLRTPEGLELRQAWQQAGTTSAKDMHEENGHRVFFFPGKVPGYEDTFPDINRINPAYFKNLDKKINYLNAHGFIPFIEVARRDIGPAWKRYYEWPDSYTRYIQYIWSRYQANICFFSPVHYDNPGSLPAEDWNPAANKVIETFGLPPFKTLVSCNPSGSSLENFGHVNKAKWIGFHQIGNFHETLGHGHRNYPLLTDIFYASPPLPGINGEPYYDGQHGTRPGSPTAALYSRSAMYGSVLSGGFGGHIYGAGKEGEAGGAMWGGNVEEAANFKVWDGIQWESGDQLRHLRTFILSEGRKYQELIPTVDLLSLNQWGNNNDWKNWVYCASTKERDFILLYFEKGCHQSTLSGLKPEVSYHAQWYNPRKGQWLTIDAGITVTDTEGKMSLPLFPGGSEVSEIDWGMKILLHGEME